MLVVLFGITGSGKSYFKDKITENLDFKKLVILTNRDKRIKEIPGIDKYFLNDQELQEKIDNNEIGYYFDFLGYRYAYLKSDLLTKDNIVMEMHYTEINKFKEMYPDALTIYVKPKNIDQAVSFLKTRNLDKQIEEKRIDELKEEFALSQDPDFERQFDYVFINNYDDASFNRMLKLIKERKNK